MHEKILLGRLKYFIGLQMANWCRIDHLTWNCGSGLQARGRTGQSLN